MERKTAGIFIFPDIELLDFCGPYEVFSVVRLDEEKRRVEPSPFNTIVISENLEIVKTSGGIKVAADYTFDNHPPLDILVVPGGWGTRREIDNPAAIRWIKDQSAKVEYTTAVCTGAVLLGKAGLLAGKRATTHWKSLGWMKELFPGTVVEKDLHVIQDGDVITSAGISAGIDMALMVVKLYHGEAVARSTAKHMEYPYPEDFRRRITI